MSTGMTELLLHVLYTVVRASCLARPSNASKSYKCIYIDIWIHRALDIEIQRYRYI